MTEETNGLLPCPFCGSKDIKFGRYAKEGWLAVICNDCGAVGPSISLTAGETAALWNIRHPDSTERGPLYDSRNPNHGRSGGLSDPATTEPVRAALEHVTELLVDTWRTAMDSDPEKEIAVFNARAALSTSPHHQEHSK